MAAELAVIGGSGFYHLEAEEAPASLFETPYDPAPVALFRDMAGQVPLWFLPRHGRGHRIPPHRINYRANIHALGQAGVRRVIAVNAVGGIAPSLSPGMLAVPDQLIDYTWGREHSFFDGLGGLHDHVDFSAPYCPRLRARLIEACQALGLPLHEGGVYGCTQGPRLETAAEIRRLERDGCAMVGMTGMPEAALARELGLDYASLCLVVNPAAGLGKEAITLDAMMQVLRAGLEDIRRLIRHAAPALQAE